jgi:SPX domain protein involved in polyphosphate accumulation
MKINIEQTNRLYEFTRQHYVEYYDLQTELVDHLANSIETQWQENPKIDFEDALKVEFKKFGVFGFSDVVEKRQIALNKKYNKIVWKHFKEFFTLPKIIGTLVVIGLTNFLLKNSFYKADAVLIVFC